MLSTAVLAETVTDFPKVNYFGRRNGQLNYSQNLMRFLISLMHGHGLYKIQTEYSQIGRAVLTFSHKAGLIIIKIVFNMKFGA